MLVIVNAIERLLMGRLRIYIFSGILVCICQILHAQEPGNKRLETVEDRITSLERKNRNQTEDLARLQRISSEDINRLQKDYKELNGTVEEYEPFVKGWKWLLPVLGFSSLAGAVWMYFVKIPKKVIEQVDKEIVDLLTTRSEQLGALLSQYDTELLVKKTHNINLLVHQDEADDFHFKELKKQGFKVTSVKKINQLSDAQLAEDEIIIINNESGHWPKSDIEDLIHKHSNHFFYIGHENIDIKGPANNRFAAARVRTQFIGNLMNVLKYK